jgi:diguanylate cyclase (GGDEF)-like protein
MLVSIRRGTDVAARYGGDEFAMLLPDTTEFGALQVAKDLRERFVDTCAAREIASSGLSIGIAALAPRPGEPLTALIEAADEALYRAKGMGRNRTEAATTEPAALAAAAA